MKKTKRLITLIITGALLSVGTLSTTASADPAVSVGWSLGPWPGIVYSSDMHSQKNGNVYNIQRALQALRYNVGTADGYFGPQTEEAVKAFQRNHAAQCQGADGRVGRLTWNCLANHLN